MHMLFQRRAMRTKLDIYVIITKFDWYIGSMHITSLRSYVF